MSSSDGTSDDLPTGEAAQAGPSAADSDAVRQLMVELHQAITQTFEDWRADVEGGLERAQPASPKPRRPVSAPPVRMEQMARTPEPTADLDDLVDILVPRLVEQLVPALRDALRDDS